MERRFRFYDEATGLEMPKPEEINGESFSVVEEFRRKADLTRINFLGGALINTNLLREGKVIDDYDLNLIGAENKTMFEEALVKLESENYQKQLEDGVTTTNLIMVNYAKDDRVYDFALKKNLGEGERLGTFDIDTLSTTLDGERRVVVHNTDALIALRTRASQLRERTRNLPRIAARMLVHVAKYDIHTFFLGENTTLPFKINPTSEEERAQNDRSLSVFSDIPKGAKAECLAKILKMIPRVKNPREYVDKINSSGLVERLFPQFSIVLKDKNFLRFLQTESDKSSGERELNSDVDVFKKLCLYSGQGKRNLLAEFEILSEARSSKKSPIVDEIKQVRDSSVVVATMQ